MTAVRGLSAGSAAAAAITDGSAVTAPEPADSAAAFAAADRAVGAVVAAFDVRGVAGVRGFAGVDLFTAGFAGVRGSADDDFWAAGFVDGA
ncbi:MAG: hypothetical protein ABWX56_06620 [Mycetocola sp.]